MKRWLPEITSVARRTVSWELIRLVDLVLTRDLPLEVAAVYAGGPLLTRPQTEDPQEELEEDGVELYHCWIVVQVEQGDAATASGLAGALVTPEATFLATHVMAPLQDEEEIKTWKRKYASPVHALTELTRAAIKAHPDSAPEGAKEAKLVRIYSDWLFGLTWEHCREQESKDGTAGTTWPWTPRRLFSILMRRNLVTITMGPVITLSPEKTNVDKSIPLHVVWKPDDTADDMVKRVRRVMADNGVLPSKQGDKVEAKKTK